MDSFVDKKNEKMKDSLKKKEKERKRKNRESNHNNKVVACNQ